MNSAGHRNDYAAGQSDSRPWGDWAVLDRLTMVSMA